jgi:uncharacterized CHY-type Zn-finger protein
MEFGKRKELAKAFSDAQQLFICKICYAGMDAENNKPLSSVKCTPPIKLCNECLKQLKHEQRNSQEKICKLCNHAHPIDWANEGNFYA